MDHLLPPGVIEQFTPEDIHVNMHSIRRVEFLPLRKHFDLPHTHPVAPVRRTSGRKWEDQADAV